MKTRNATILIITLCLITIRFNTYGQSSEDSYSKQFEWDDESETKTIYVDVSKKSSTLQMNFTGSVKEGSMWLEFIDPEGEKYPGFNLITNSQPGSGSNVSVSTNTNTNSVTTNSSGTTISTLNSKSGNTSSVSSSSSPGHASTVSTTSDESGAKGVVNKVITNPMPGKWKFVIKVKKMTGELLMDIDQF